MRKNRDKPFEYNADRHKMLRMAFAGKILYGVHEGVPAWYLEGIPSPNGHQMGALISMADAKLLEIPRLAESSNATRMVRLVRHNAASERLKVTAAGREVLRVWDSRNPLEETLGAARAL